MAGEDSLVYVPPLGWIISCGPVQTLDKIYDGDNIAVATEKFSISVSKLNIQKGGEKP